MAVASDLFTDARVRREADALATDGHDVTVIGFDYRVGRSTAERLDNGVNIVRLPFASRDQAHFRRVLSFGAFWARASWHILKSPADVVHAHNLHLALPCVAAAARRRVPLVYDAHEVVDVMLSGVMRTMGVRYERWVWRRAQAVITTNRGRAEHLQRLHGGDLPFVLGNYPQRPPALRPVDLRAQLSIPNHHRILIYQGGFYLKDRCFDRVARALATMPTWHFVLVGFGSQETRNVLRRQLDEAGLGERGHILPPVDAADLLHLTAGADAGVIPLLPVVGNELGDTNKLYEYLSAGKPAVGSDFPEIRRSILDNPVGPVGTVFDPDDQASIEMALKELDARLLDFAAPAAEVGATFFSWEIESRTLTSLYADFERPPAMARSDG